MKSTIKLYMRCRLLGRAAALAAGMAVMPGVVSAQAHLAAPFDATLPSLSADAEAQRLALKGIALFESNDPACIDTLLYVTKNYPTSPYSTRSLLTAGDWHWFQKDWHKALDLYNQVNIPKLAPGERDLYTYRKALALLNCGVREEASPLFTSLLKSADYAQAAEYYNAYILYLDGEYDKAYDIFSRIAKAGQQEGIEPLYYMAQIEYMRGQYDDVIDHASSIIAKRPVAELLPELHRIAGLSYFKTDDFASARPHLEKFVAATDSPNDDAVYALAAIEYDAGDTDKARARFRSLTDRNNMIAQGSYLYLGQIAQQEGDMNEAAMAFNKAANLSYDPRVAETALYNYIVANSNGGAVPFASSIQMHEEFLRRYPTSVYASDVEESLASAFFRENNYSKALEAISKVKNPSETTLATKQKILYRLGCGEISSGQLGSAVTHLREAAAINGGDPVLNAESRLWLGEALYRSGDYKAATEAYSRTLKGNLSPANKLMARYGLAYSQFQLSQWSDAGKNFAAVAAASGTPLDVRADALIREADCLFYSREFAKAASKYKAASAGSYGDTDYAAFRHAVVSGVTEGSQRELNLLDEFLAAKPDSRWTAEALLEAARTATAMERKDKAADYYDRLLDVRPDLPEAGEALFNKAIHLENEEDAAGALEAFLSLERRGGKDYETEAVAGVMRNTSDPGQRAEYARRLLSLGGVMEEDAEYARFYDAAGLLRSDNPKAGEDALSSLAENPDNLSGAMAAVELGEWCLNKGDVDKALQVLEKFTDAGSIHAYWLAKGFIALADAYHAKGDDYLAVEYLKSLRDNYPGDEADIREAINSKITEYSR